MKTLFIVFCSLTAIPATAQPAGGQREAQWWIAPADSPLSFQMDSTGRHLDLVNTSQEVVIAHTLGCVIQTSKGYRTVKIFQEDKTELKPKDALLTSADWYRDKYLPKCGAETAKLAVVKITFSNGNKWTLRSAWDRRKPYTKDGKQIIAPAQPGAYKDVKQPGTAEVDPYKAADPSKQKPADVQADVVWHVHPSAEVTESSGQQQGAGIAGSTTVIGGTVTIHTYSFVQSPSAVDQQIAAPAPTLNLVVGARDKTVYVYDSSGCSCKESLKDFNKEPK